MVGAGEHQEQQRGHRAAALRLRLRHIQNGGGAPEVHASQPLQQRLRFTPCSLYLNGSSILSLLHYVMQLVIDCAAMLKKRWCSCNKSFCLQDLDVFGNCIDSGMSMRSLVWGPWLRRSCLVDILLLERTKPCLRVAGLRLQGVKLKVTIAPLDASQSALIAMLVRKCSPTTLIIVTAL